MRDSTEDIQVMGWGEPSQQETKAEPQLPSWRGGTRFRKIPVGLWYQSLTELSQQVSHPHRFHGRHPSTHRCLTVTAYSLRGSVLFGEAVRRPTPLHPRDGPSGVWMERVSQPFVCVPVCTDLNRCDL